MGQVDSGLKLRLGWTAKDLKVSHKLPVVYPLFLLCINTFLNSMALRP
jgi:hypothetical protein